MSQRIVFILSQSLERPSGLGRYWPLSRALAAQGKRVTILALHPNWRNLRQRHIWREGVEIHYVGQMHIRQSETGKAYFSTAQLLAVVFLSTLRLLWHTLRVPADLIVIGKAHPMNGLAGMIGHWLRRVPVWLDCDDYETGSNRFAGRWQRSIVSWFEAHLPRGVDRISVNTGFMRNYVLALGVPPDRIRLISNGVERERFTLLVESEVVRLRAQLNGAEQHFVLYLGSLSLVSHAVDLLLDAFALVAQDVPDVVLLIVGGGEDYGKLREQAARLSLQERVRFVGVASPDRAPLYYHVAEVAVDPVRDDEASRARSPLKLFESWAAGVPFVTGDVGDRRALLIDNAAGVLVAPGDPAALAEGIKRVLQDRALADRLRHNARLARERYWWDVLVRDWML